METIDEISVVLNWVDDDEVMNSIPGDTTFTTYKDNNNIKFNLKRFLNGFNIHDIMFNHLQGKTDDGCVVIIGSAGERCNDAQTVRDFLNENTTESMDSTSIIDIETIIYLGNGNGCAGGLNTNNTCTSVNSLLYSIIIGMIYSLSVGYCAFEFVVLWKVSILMKPHYLVLFHY